MKPLSVSTQIIINAAREMGIESKIIRESRIVELSYRGHKEYLCAQYMSNTTSVAKAITDHKEKTKEFIKAAGISVAQGQSFWQDEEQKALAFTTQIGFPVVLKPTNSTHGYKVFIDIQEEKSFHKAWAEITNHFNKVLIEKFFPGGTEYRILATKDKVLAITNRVPANVVGDGIHTIKELIEIKNSDPKRGDDSYLDYSKPFVRIEIDDVVLNTLIKNRLDLNTIPQKNQQIFLRENSNLSTGGDSVDTTDIAHPSVKEIALKVINAIPGLSYGGIDFLTTDITREQKASDYIIIEINASPGLVMHHFPFEGKARDVATELLLTAFPERKL